ncbi:Transcriptional activator protein CopR [compost metagenome]
MKILAAEDDPEICTYLQQGLSEAGFAVDRVESGSKVLQQALAEAYDLLLIDVIRLGLDGWEVLRRLRDSG